MLADPVGLVLHIEPVGGGAVGEDVDEGPAVRLQPAAHLAKQGPPVGHVLEHLHRDDPVESPGPFEAVHVGGQHRDIGQACGPGLLADIGPLACGVGDRRDLRAGQGAGHPQGQRSPATAQLQDLLPVSKAGVLGGRGERVFLGRGQILDAGAIEAAGIFQLRAQHLLKEGRRQLVVLFIGRGGVFGDGPGGHLLRKGGLGLGAGLAQLPPGVGHQQFDGGPTHEVGRGRPFKGLDGRTDKAHGGGVPSAWRLRLDGCSDVRQSGYASLGGSDASAWGCIRPRTRPVLNEVGAGGAAV